MSTVSVHECRCADAGWCEIDCSCLSLSRPIVMAQLHSRQLDASVIPKSPKQSPHAITQSNFVLSIYAYRGGRDYQHDCGHAHGGASTIARAEALHPQRPRSLSHGCVPVIILGQVRLPRAPSGILQSRNEVEVLSTITRGKCCEWNLSEF